jgi:hypothetical protein
LFTISSGWAWINHCNISICGWSLHHDHLYLILLGPLSFACLYRFILTCWFFTFSLGCLYHFSFFPLIGPYFQDLFVVIWHGTNFLWPLHQDMLNILLGNAKAIGRSLQSCKLGDENMMEITFKLKIFLIHVNELAPWYVVGLHSQMNDLYIPFLESCVILTLDLFV